MKFLVRPPKGPPHDVELQGTVAVLGRDPSCDLVLNDAKCSRRHAVVEAGPEGIVIRDAGSANGVYVNGEKVDRANLQEGDEVRLGEVHLTVLAEEIPGTVVMGPEDMVEMDVAPSPPPVPPKPAATPAPPQPPQPAVAPSRVPVAPVVSPAPPAVVPVARHAAGATPPLAAPPPHMAPPPVSAPVTPATAPRPVPAAVSPARPPASPPKPPVAAPPRRRPPAERPRLAARAELGTAGPIQRPLTVTVLAVLWMVSIALFGAGGLSLVALASMTGTAAGVTVAAAIALGLLGVVMAFGLWSQSPWARLIQLAVAGFGVLTCVFTLPSIAVLVYMLRDDVRIRFSDRRDFRDLAPQEAETVRRGSSEGLFTGTILSGVLLGAIVAAVLAAVATPAFLRAKAAAGGAAPTVERTGAEEAAAISQLRRMVAAQEAFRAGTCGTGYADLEGLLHPASTIPNYAPDGPSFLTPERAPAQHGGNGFELVVEDPVPPAEGCPTRSFRRYRYSATPLAGTGRFLVAGPDGTIHAATGRPARLEDPPIE